MIKEYKQIGILHGKQSAKSSKQRWASAKSGVYLSNIWLLDS